MSVTAGEAVFEPKVARVSRELLRAWPLPLPAADGDKEERGRLLIVGGSREIPGAVVLAATAALRAGAGKLTIATGASVAAGIAQAIPEARVIGLNETATHGFVAADAARLPDAFDAVLIGPGMQDEAAACEFVRALLPRLRHATVILDANAMNVRGGSASAGRFSSRVVLTPHAGEMAHLLGVSKEQVQADPLLVARHTARQWNAVIALKGAHTIIAEPQGASWLHEGGNAGLAVSGSGDTLAGIVAALAARGATPEQSAVWSVALHALAGEALARQIGPLGFLAREIAAVIPRLLHSLGE